MVNKERIETLEQLIEMNLIPLRSLSFREDRKMYEDRLNKYCKEYRKLTGRPYVSQPTRDAWQ